MENKVDNTNEEKDEEHHGTEGISNYTRFNSLVHLCGVLQGEISDHHNIRKDQQDSIEKKSSNQQEEEEDINGESELNGVTCGDSHPDNSDNILSDNNVNYGSKLWARDENDGNYRIMKGIPRSIKFRSINNLYQSTNRLSPVEDEFNWNLSTQEDPNMNLSAKKDSSIITNKNGNGEKDTMTSST